MNKFDYSFFFKDDIVNYLLWDSSSPRQFEIKKMTALSRRRCRRELHAELSNLLCILDGLFFEASHTLLIH